MINFKALINIFYTLCILHIIAQDAVCQVTRHIIGTWKVAQLQTDRIYKNFENDSIFLYEKEDKEKYKFEDVRNAMNQVAGMFSNFSFSFFADNTFTTKMGSEIDKGKYMFDSKKSIIILKSSKTLDTFRLTSSGLIVYDMGDEYDKIILTLKRRSN